MSELETVEYTAARRCRPGKAYRRAAEFESLNESSGADGRQGTVRRGGRMRVVLRLLKREGREVS